MDKNLKVIVSGGGTGGHIFPAISIADAIKAAKPDAEILFVGAEGRMEMTRVPAAGYDIIGLPICGFDRKNPLKNIVVLFKLMRSQIKAKKVIRKFKPDVVVGVGGYASGPTLRMAGKLGIPTLIQEQNSYAGVTNKLLAKDAAKICVAYEDMERFFPAEKIMITGNPVRKNLVENKMKRSDAALAMNLDPSKRILLIVGGSLGARTLNESVMANLDLIRLTDDVQIIWQTGKYYIEEMKQRLAAEAPVPNLFPTDFISNMDAAYGAADLVVSRAGAGTISELCLLKKPVILVPSPNVAEDHQTKNAMALANRDAAIHIADANAKKELMPAALDVVKDKEKLADLSANIFRMALIDSAEIIADEVLKLAKVSREKPFSIDNIEAVYFIGAGGIGMSALIRYFLKTGKRVAGYDRTPSDLTSVLISEGADIHFEEGVEFIPDYCKQREKTLVVYTPAIPSNHKEFVWFQEQNFEIQKRAQVLGTLTESLDGLCVAGTHGKTTTSTMLAHILNQRAEKVNAFLGGISKNYESNLIVSHADQVVVEADEYDRSFLRLKPSMAIITATDADHLDIYGTKEELLKTFAQFTSLIEENGVLVMKKGLEMVPDVKESVKVYEYSGTEKADFYAENIVIENGELYFDFVGLDKRIEKVQLGVPVMINVENAVAAMAIAMLNGMSANTIKNAVKTFKGSVRRFDIKVKNERKVYIDDYAHHPEEIKACVDSIRSLYPDKRICGIFQPHLYSRTKDFASEFAESLSKLDDVIVLDIYPARELPIKGVTSNLIHKKIKGKKSVLCKKEECLEELKRHNFDVLITIGAGNIDQLVNPITEYVNKL